MTSANAPDSIARALQQTIAEALPEAEVDVLDLGNAHFAIDVAWKGFEGTSTLERQRAVYRAIAPLMRGEPAPVHAIDRLVTRVR